MEDTLAFDVIPWINLGSPIGRSNRRIGWKERKKEEAKRSKKKKNEATRCSLIERGCRFRSFPPEGQKDGSVSRSSTRHCDDSNDAPCKLDGLQPDNGRLYANAIGFWQRRPIGFSADQLGWTWGSTGCPFDIRLVVIESQGFSRLRPCFEARSSIDRPGGVHGDRISSTIFRTVAVEVERWERCAVLGVLHGYGNPSVIGNTCRWIFNSTMNDRMIE